MKTELKKILKKLGETGGKLERTALITPVITNAERAEGEDAEYLFKLSFSSEEPYERWFGMEILGHKKSEVDMGWVKSGTAPLLNQHDPADLIGVIESAKLESGRGTAVVRFGKSARAQEIRLDVIDGIRTNVSVGYRVHEMKLVESADDGPDIYRVTKWQPLEVSLVALPADLSVGVGRSDSEIERAAPAAASQKKENNMDLKARAKKMGLHEDASEESVLAAERAAFLAEGKKAAATEFAAEHSMKPKRLSRTIARLPNSAGKC